ncbi:MAG: FlgD immunoglobulin-like domain containing protein [Candidatus Eisenbacteria bacterium]
MMRAALAVGLISCLATAAPTRTALAAWPNQPNVNLPVCRATDSQYSPAAVPDGSGGAIIVWDDYRAGNGDIYAQHVLASGIVDPAWPVDGRAICVLPSDQTNVVICPDAGGSAILAWSDNRSGSSYDIYAQHVLSSGVLDPAWPANGRAICTVAQDQTNPVIVSDGAGGAIMAWTDNRPVSASDIYAGHVLASGVVDPAWPAGGRAICAAAGNQSGQQVVTDGAGGAIVGWSDERSGASNDDIYAQHVSSSGVVDPAWPVDGSYICNQPSYQFLNTMAADGGGGAFLAWQDLRAGVNYNIYVEHVLPDGILDSWPGGGVQLAPSIYSQRNSQLVPDGSGGVIVAWIDGRSGYDMVFAQHVIGGGGIDPYWSTSGLQVTYSGFNKSGLTVAPDGSGGMLAGFEDRHATNTPHIYAQHILAAGYTDPSWPSDSRAVCLAGTAQLEPTMTTDGAGGAILAWGDYRTSYSSTDIYAQRVEAFGYLGNPEPAITGVRDIPNDNGGEVKVSWNASYLDASPNLKIDSYWVLRSVPSRLMAQEVARGARVLSGSDDPPRPGERAFVRVAAAAAPNYAWEYVTSQPAFHVPSYSYVATTTGDSMGVGNPKTTFMIMARTYGGGQWWFSAPDSGYSVDNVPPVTPAPFRGTFSGGTGHLHWGSNTEPDLLGYRLYRGSNAGFVPGAGNLLSAQPDTGYTDPSGSAGYYYKLSAVDIHGNESAYALLTPAGTTAVAPGGMLTLAFAPVSPNPAHGDLSMRFTLPVAADVALVISDLQGRQVACLARGRFEAGAQEVRWTGSDAAGHTLGSGIYFATLTAGGERRMQRFAIVR